MKPFLAMIVPMGEAPGGGDPPGIWGGANQPFPTPPIHIPGQPPGIWGPTDPRPTHPIAGVPGLPGYQPPGQPPGIWGPPGPWPTPPIHMPPGSNRPPGIWGGANEPFPPPPIVIPPQRPGDPPLVIWGGGNQPFPTPPIELPGEGEPPPGGEPVRLVEWHTAWTEETGWIIVGTPGPNVPHPAPSKK